MDPERALPLLLRARERWPQDALTELDLARNAQQRGQTAAAETYLLAAATKDITQACHRPMLISTLVRYLQAHQRDHEAEHLFQGLERAALGPELRYGLALEYAIARHLTTRAAYYTERFEATVSHRIAAVTWTNYHRIYDKVRRSGALLVCAQYAGRPLAPLRALTQDMPEAVIVDNRQPFAAYIAQGRYDELFLDHCYGDLGHGTTLGNTLLARNIAQALLAQGVGQGVGQGVSKEPGPVPRP